MNKKSDSCKLTILTPTYNRKYILHKLYNSLTEQSDKRFVWFIVDDGSNDSTKEQVDRWEKENIINIKYVYKKNGGKHTAINFAMKMIDTEYTFIVDSDDYLLKNSVETIYGWMEDIDSQEMFAGMSGTRGNYVGNELKILGQYPFGCESVVASNLERRQKYLIGDKAEIYKTNFLKNYPFPEYERERFISEDVVFNRIALDGYKLKWYPDILTVCEYLSDGLTASVKQIEHFKDNINGYKDSYRLNFIGLKFPYNYSSAVEFYIKMKQIGKKKDVYEILNLSLVQKILLKLAYVCKLVLKRTK